MAHIVMACIGMGETRTWRRETLLVSSRASEADAWGTRQQESCSRGSQSEVNTQPFAKRSVHRSMHESTTRVQAAGAGSRCRQPVQAASAGSQCRQPVQRSVQQSVQPSAQRCLHRCDKVDDRPAALEDGDGQDRHGQHEANDDKREIPERQPALRAHSWRTGGTGADGT